MRSPVARPLALGALLLAMALARPVAAQVPPPPPVAPAPPVESAPPGLRLVPRDTMVLTPPPKPDFEAIIAASIDRFQEAYTRKSSPKIAVYWNRQLSDRINEWRRQERIALTSASDRREAVKVEDERRQANKSDLSIEKHTAANDPQRQGPDELWMGEFQSGVLDPLLQAGAQVVDRATIIRLMAATNPAAAGSAGMLSEQHVEMKALQGFAQLVIEILATPSRQASAGYELTAVVKDVNSGVILANVNSRNMKRELLPATKEYVATPRGFELRETPPRLFDVARNLTINVMDAMTSYWSR